jgi:hypothetical protein
MASSFSRFSEAGYRPPYMIKNRWAKVSERAKFGGSVLQESEGERQCPTRRSDLPVERGASSL